MIRIPKEVEKTMKTLETAGFECYAVGECVRDALINLKPLDWDVATNAQIDDMKKLFPECKVISTAKNIIRLEFGDIEDDGIILDISHYRNGENQVLTINEDLEGRGFTCNAIGVTLSRIPVDPFGGRKDIRERNMRTVGIVDKVFEENPEKMLEMIRIAAEMRFELPKDAKDAIAKCADLLMTKNNAEVATQLLLLVDSYNGCDTVQKLWDYGLLQVLIGKPYGKKLHIKEKSELDMYLKNIHKAEDDPLVKLSLLYLCFENAKTRDAIKMLHFAPKIEDNLITAHKEMNISYTVNDKLKLKDFINRIGLDNYEFVQRVALSRKLVLNERFDAPYKRAMLMKQIKASNEVLTMDDVPITEADILEAGIVSTEREAMELRCRVLDACLKENFDKGSDFMALARDLKANKRKFQYKNIRWIKN